MSLKRLLLAYLSAPLLPAVLQAALGESEYHPLAVFVIAAIVIYVLELIVGIPGYLFLRRAGRHRLPAYALLGFCIGAVLVMALWMYSRSFEQVLTGLLASAWFGFLGAATTAGFWLVARPDRRVAPSDPAQA